MPLELRPLTREAAPSAGDFLAAVDESRASLARWMPWYHADYGRADVERWFAGADRMRFDAALCSLLPDDLACTWAP